MRLKRLQIEFGVREGNRIMADRLMAARLAKRGIRPSFTPRQP